MPDLCRNETSYYFKDKGEDAEASNQRPLANRPRGLKHLRAALLAGVFIATLSSSAMAQTVWNGSNSSNWFDGGNWSTGAVPTAAGNAMIDLSSPEARIAGANAFADTVYVGGAGTGRLDIFSGSLKTNQGLLGMTSGSSGVVDISGGWDTAFLVAGYNGQGSVHVHFGGSVVSNGAVIGANADAVGSVRVTGTAGLNSTWFNSGRLSVGANGYGTLQIENRGLVKNMLVVSVGEVVGGKGGAVTVTGADSTLTLENSFLVGDGTKGTLVVSNRGLVLGKAASIGHLSSGVGDVTVTGVSSRWENTLSVFVGNAGNGQLAVLDGGRVLSDSGFVGADIGSVGTVLVNGSGSRWEMASSALIGDRSQGTLLIENGGTVSNDDGVVGAHITGRGSAHVTGAGSQWINNRSLIVGREGVGSLVISNGGKVSSSRGWVGQLSGQVVLAGPGSTWINTGSLTVGDFGKGAIVVAGGGGLTSGDAFIGSNAGATGTVSVSGAGSTWTVSFGDDIEIGVSGTGSLSITDGGKVGAGLIGRIAKNDGSVGSVLVSGAGSLWDMRLIAVGDEGTGTMSIESGGRVNSEFASIGDNGPGKGLATVRGAGSTWMNVGAGISLYVGYEADGALLVTDGGTMVSAGDSVIGDAASATGKAFVTGAGSTWTIARSDDLEIGTSGTGSLVVGDGGKVAGGLIGRIAKNAGSTGSVLVSGTGSLWSMDLIGVGDEGTGTLIVENGGITRSGFASIGDSGSSKGLAIVRGAGSTWDNSDVVGPAYVGYEADGTLMLTDGGRFVAADGAGAIEIAVMASAKGTVDIGAGLGETAVAPGILDVRTVAFGAGTGTLNFNHTATNYVFAPALTGRGNVNVMSGTTVLTGSSRGFLGATSVNGAKLVVNGQLGGTLSVQANGWLAGSGTVGTTNLASGATIAPGNSIGTLSVAGDISFAAGSTYQLEVGASGRSDLIDATGQAALSGGTVAIVPLAGFARDSRYTILSAAGGVSGTFDGFLLGQGRSAFLTPSLSYDANNVFLAINQTATLDSAGRTPNEIAIAQGLDSLAAGNSLLEAVLQLDAPGARAAFDLLSGEVHASAKAVFLQDSGLIREAMVNRLRTWAGDAPAVHAMGASSDSAVLGGLALWGRAVGSWGKTEGDGNAASLDRSTGGFLLGADAAISDEWRLGVLAGYSRTSFDVETRASSGDSDNAHLGIYGGAVLDQVVFRAGAAYSWHNVDTQRHAAFAGFDEKLSAGYDAGTAQMFGEIGYQLQAGGLDLEPFANLAYVNLHTDAFSENGGTGALTSSSSTADATFTTLGMRAETDFALGEIWATAHGLIGWRHVFGDRTPDADFSFAAGNVFAIAGAPLARDAAVLEAGLGVTLSPSARLGVSYSGQFGGGARDHGIRADFAVRF
ncbi:autotransporter outer membrane beta-barrel domain-containing protein [Mesorhizobium loti]|nr:autotransporter domain-containing protein [Mesorhizobium loti]PLP60421.1 autotransporter outer membrane beta-barrel domain-containing protein [Mesorhizobium loti]